MAGAFALNLLAVKKRPGFLVASVARLVSPPRPVFAARLRRREDFRRPERLADQLLYRNPDDSRVLFAARQLVQA